MAAKEVQKEAKKNVEKKGRRRLKRSVRKTLGALFLASSIAVAAIPTEGLQAAVDPQRAKKVTVHDYNATGVDSDLKTNIPIVDDNEPIYTTGDGRFQFAYIYPSSVNTGSKIAIILNCEIVGNLDGGLLEIPNAVDAYKKYTTGTTAGGYAAVNKNGDFLYYQDYEIMYDDQHNPIPDTNDDGTPKKDDAGNPIYKKQLVYKPCYYEDRGNWEKLGETEFYYRSGSMSNNDFLYLPTTTDGVQRIHDAVVAYIGNQYLVGDESDSSGQSWKVGGKVTEKNPNQGIFAGESKIGTLRVGKDLSGIGNYAFYNCAGIERVELGNGIGTIGNYAFANCISLKEVSIPFKSNLYLLGDHVFYNCYNLHDFTMPIAVRKIGDSAFEECRSMTSVLLNGKDDNGASMLNELGYDVFKGCSSLESLTFPSSLKEAVDVTTFQGCKSLKFIGTESPDFDVIPGKEPDDNGKGQDSKYTLEQFKEEMLSTFYFRGPMNEKLHKTATENEFAFSYYDSALERDVYELTVKRDGKKSVYRVDSNNELVYHKMDDDLETVEIPTAIGPYGIKTIDELTFQNNCSIVKIVIPGTITKIEKNAFRGCHRLKDVIFDNPSASLVIEAGAFKTQDVSMNTHIPCVDPTPSNSPKLNFVGPISNTSAPFLYAMRDSENINYGSQPVTYITYYSGWPSNLVVTNVDGKSTLIDYPTFQELKDGKYKSEDYAYITEDYEKAAARAIKKYTDADYQVNPDDPTDTEELTQNEMEIINASLNIVLPTGIEAIGTKKDKEGNVLGLFAYKEKYDETKVENLGNDHVLKKSITAYGLLEVADRAFSGCEYISTVRLEGNTQSIGTHAFENCESLTNVSVPAAVNKMGLSPFIGCKKLSNVNFGGGPYFICENSIIYEMNDEGKKDKLVEYLGGRSSTAVRPDEIAGISEIYSEAFMGTGVGTVDLSTSKIKDVPISAFQHTLNLFSVTLPDTCLSISADAFSDSNIQQVHIPDSVTFLHNDSFRDTDEDGLTNLKQLEFECVEGSAAATFADQNNIKWTPYIPIKYFTVEFLDWDLTSLKVETVQQGYDATPPTAEEMPERKGYTHVGWSLPYTTVTKDIDTVALYVEDSEVYYTITFYNDDYSVYMTQEVRSGRDAIVPNNPASKSNPGAEFQGWVIFGGNDSGKAPTWTNIRSDMSVIAVFKGGNGGPGSSGSPDPNNPDNPNDPNASGSPNPNDPNASGSPNPNDPNASGSPNPNGPNASGSPDPNGSGGSGSNANKLYTLTVQNGSGSGSYAEGAQPVIIANDPASGQEFDHWSISPADVKIASLVLSASVITMPAQDVTVTAHYKVKTGGSGYTGSGNNSQRPNGNVNSVTKNGTTVVIDKNGLSNTGVVSATVHGSSDNFTIKITDTTEATEAALRALMNEYGNLDNIKYFPMDISLYDSTGTNKITDTTGLSVSITLPLPDSLITYAGNNKVASTLNDRLEKLSARFTTIQGVSCITFTAEHFSPYVIYVDTGDLSSGLVSDSTPKTGDGIHPKWFLSIGLACLSFVFFIQKDTKRQKKVKVKAKA